jgi:murein L,D-transpeptidase YcbB/YkuD
MGRFRNITGKGISVLILALSVKLALLACVPASQQTATVEPETPPTAVHDPSRKERLSGAINQKVTASAAARSITAGGRNMRLSPALPAFYQKRAYEAVWIDDNGNPRQADELVEAVKAGYYEGLNPEDYGLTQMEAVLARVKSAGNKADTADLAELDVLFSNSFLTYANDIYYGQVTPEQLDMELIFGERRIDLGDLMAKAASDGNVKETLNGLFPKYPVYGKLRTALERYRQLEASGGWQPIPPGPKLQKGARGPRVTALKQRLAVTGELDGADLSNDVFDQALDQAVRKYQERNGLYVDGVVGDSTFESLNVPASVRVNQIELTMERWRLLPQNLGTKFILVNIANFHLYGVENNSDFLDMRIVVGKPEWNTPIFSEEMTHIELNPYWNIPTSIFKDDIAPNIKADPDYLKRKNIQAVGLKYSEPEGADEEAIALAREEYVAKVLSGNYRLRQNPGPANPLGRIKFLFPNRHAVYLHDTPNRGYFKRAQRNFSHGCIRVERPYELAEFVLAPDAHWNHDTIEKAINSGKTRTLHLQTPLPVYILYFTAWADDDGTVNFHKDIYGLDQVLQNALLQSKGRSVDMASSGVN